MKNILFIVVALSSLLSGGCLFSKKLPDCTDLQVQEILKKAISDTPAFKLLEISNVDIVDISERPTSTADKKICRGNLNLGDQLGSQVIYFSIDWQNKDNGEYWVQTIQGE